MHFDCQFALIFFSVLCFAAFSGSTVLLFVAMRWLVVANFQYGLVIGQQRELRAAVQDVHLDFIVMANIVMSVEC